MNRKTKELNRSNNALDQQISPENREAFTDMICYLRGAKISAYHQELVRYDLTEMLRGQNLSISSGVSAL